MLLHVSATNVSHINLQTATADEEREKGATAFVSAVHGTLYILRLDC
jgi:hypothetical protein